MVSYHNIYEGSGYGDASYGLHEDNFVGYRVDAGKLGASLKPDTAAQIVEANNMLNQGIKPIEIGALSPDVFDQIPKQHFKETARLMKLTGAKPTLHSPLVEASGIVENQWTEENQYLAENRLKEVIDKAHSLSPDKPMPVTMHSANIPGTTFEPGKDGKYKTTQLIAVNRETGKVETALREEERAYPGDIAEYGKAVRRSPEKQLEIINGSQWHQKINNFSEHKKNVDDVLDNSIRSLMNAGINQQESKRGLRELSKSDPSFDSAYLQFQKANVALNNAETTFGSMFQEAWKYSDDEDTKKELKKLANEWASYQPTKNNKELLKKLKNGQLSLNDQMEIAKKKSDVLDRALIHLDSLKKTPQIYQPIEEFAIDKTTKTFANVAKHSYDKYGKNAPIVSIENLYPGMAYAKPEEFRKVIKDTRKNFVNALMSDKKKNISEEEAKKIANKVIGVTWDVGHLNIMKKHGFKDEDLAKATKKVAKDIKHLHFTDNFGYSDSHLPTGMGNVPFKKHLEHLEKAGLLGKDGVNIINESGGFVQHFKTSPHPYNLSGFGSSIYGSEGPFGNQMPGVGAYFAGYGTTLPEQHFSMYGSGFSGLPTEVGGQIPGKQSRFSGAPNA